MQIAVACGGTGGHAYPGVVTAEALRRRGHAVTLWLAGRDAESGVVAGWQGPVVSLNARGFDAMWSPAAISVAGGQMRAIASALRQMRVRRPDVLLAMGSYSSVAPVVSARLLGVPVVLHEANAIPGRAIALLARLACKVGITFPSSSGHLPAGKVVETGLPLRPLADARFEGAVLDAQRLTLLVMGGSQGAHRLNEVVPEAILRLHAAGLPVQVVHLSGRADEAMVRAIYAGAGVPHLVYGYLSEMDKAYRIASVAVCRSGAGTCMELARSGIPAIYIPLPTARRNHQHLNALAMVQGGGGVLLPQSELTAGRLASELDGLLHDRPRLQGMQAALRRMPIGDGAERLADLVVACVRNGGV